ncbi:mitochondrial ACP precursor, putative [Plasmodium vinckei vinckei]|uniref:Mitochondrial ACP, putative n=1 Tax=Plasmodium vinckei vinckei TaxID=54757 RepID=A0A081ICR2_PLAVN|nr:mitochondrial ACP precursor, putative [Plasmodium vinckei vinckei]KEG01470.1 hypothetical protein YYE_03566 [Plasmodium vinckei vinckei]VEV55449.1 mitochondrial ACP precursor, putative [Plasmodium vinckei vinckei]
MRNNILRKFITNNKNVKSCNVLKRGYFVSILSNNGMKYNYNNLYNINNYFIRGHGQNNIKYFSTENEELSSYTKEQIEEKVLNVLKKYISPDAEINYNEDLEKNKTKDDRAWDFLDTVEFLIDIESEFNITIPDETADGIKTVQEVIDYLVKLNIKKT